MNFRGEVEKSEVSDEPTVHWRATRQRRAKSEAVAPDEPTLEQRCLERKITKVPLFEKKNAGVPVY
jgi:hypothetical protein